MSLPQKHDLLLIWLHYSQAMEGGEVTQRTVVLTRAEGVGLGFNIIGGEGDTGVFISHISSGSIADKSGQLQAGDLIVQVSGELVSLMRL